MTNLVDSLQAPPRADGATMSEPGHANEPGHPEVLRGVRSAAPFSPLTSDLRPPTSKRSALTLIEMLVALAVTLVMMAAVVNLFANMSASIRNRRAAIETGSQLRQVRNRLAMDLSGATCRGSTWQDPAENQGYIEIIEGRWSDKNPSHLIDGDPGNDEIDYTTSLVPSSQGFSSEDDTAADGRIIGLGAVTDGRALGDWDDVLALTVRSESDPFTARVTNPVTTNDELVESPLAEVFWFARQPYDTANPDPNDGFRRIYRKVLLIAPWLGPWPGAGNPPPPNVSVHWDTSQTAWVANTLGDLTKRENRGYRDPADVFPHRFIPGRLPNPNVSQDFLVLSNALAFDVRLFDPGAPLYQVGTTILEPGDYGWDAAVGGTATGYGAYCDLGWGRQPNAGTPTYLYPSGANAAIPLGTGTWPSLVPVPTFHITHEDGWHPRAPNVLADYSSVYDTWSYHYENDGLNQDSAHSAPYNTVFDQGANGLDDDNANGVDDRGERETAPPYDVPLRGVKVILRVYEPDARQIRESSVTHSFKQ